MNDNKPTIKLESAQESSAEGGEGVLRIRENSQRNSFVVQVSVSDADTGDGGRVDCYMQLPNGVSKIGDALTAIPSFRRG